MTKTKMRDCRDCDEYANVLDSLVDVGQCVEFRGDLGIVNDAGTADLRAAKALARGKGNCILYISA